MVQALLVEKIEKYLKLEKRFRELGYKPWQFQYSWDQKEGLHVWFLLEGHENIEVVTHSKEISDAISAFRDEEKI